MPGTFDQVSATQLARNQFQNYKLLTDADAFRGFLHYASLHGAEQAKKILENEKLVLERTREFVKTHNINSDFVDTTTFEVCLSQESADYQAKALAAYQAAGGDISQIQVHEGNEAKAKTRVPNAIRAYEWLAASNNPAKLVQWILTDFITKGGKLWTHCPATKVTAHGARDTSARWDVHTARGTIAAETVIHCTNAYTGLLLPQLRTFIRPRRSQANSFIPRSSLSGADTLKKTMALRYSADHFFSVNPLRDGTIVFGGSGTRDGSDSETEKWKALVTFDDTGYNDSLARNSQRELANIASESVAEPLRHGEGFDYAWTGIQGITSDNAPVVGAVHGLEGQWVCAGFNGHGMAIIFTCAPGLARLVAGGRWEETGLPECFQASRLVKSVL
jgi:glycine/D-amino acid oxidase-like deaminating enzyme